jgi:rhodanese-related sulfurtransferase
MTTWKPRKTVGQMVEEAKTTHVPRGMLEFWLDPTSHYYSGKIDPTKRIIVYCAGGQRSALAADVLREMGFPSVGHLAVGFNGWAEAGRAVEREPDDRGVSDRSPAVRNHTH